MAAHLILPLVEDMFDELGNHLCVCLRLKEMPPLCEKHPDIFVICDDSIVDHNKLIGLI